MTKSDYKRVSIEEFTKAAEVYETDEAGVYKMCKKDYPDVLSELEKEPFDNVLDCGCGTAPINVQDFFNSVQRCLKPGGRLILRDMTMGLAISRWFCNHIMIPILNMQKHGDVHVHGKKEVDELCRNAGLKMEIFEKRGFCRLHCVAKKVG